MTATLLPATATHLALPLTNGWLLLLCLLQPVDLLSDLSEDDDISTYLATKEEAELKGLLWTEMNK